MLNLATGKAFTRRESIKGLAAILAAGCAPSIARAAARGVGGMARMRGAAAAAAAVAARSAKNYEMDGLIAMWDGIENAGWGVHSNDTLTWVNLGSLGSTADATATASHWGDAYHEYPNSGDNSCIFHTPTGFLTNYMAGEWSVECVWSPFSGWFSSSGYPGIFGNHSSGLGIVGGQSEGSAPFSLHSPTFMFYRFSYSAFTTGVSESVSMTASASELKAGFYRRGQKLSDLTPSEASDVTLTCPGGFNIGSAYTSYSRVFKGRIFCTRVYNRALTAAEIAHNYAVDKARFGLT